MSKRCNFSLLLRAFFFCNISDIAVFSVSVSAKLRVSCFVYNELVFPGLVRVIFRMHLCSNFYLVSWSGTFSSAT